MRLSIEPLDRSFNHLPQAQVWLVVCGDGDLSAAAVIPSRTIPSVTPIHVTEWPNADHVRLTNQPPQPRDVLRLIWHKTDGAEIPTNENVLVAESWMLLA